MLSPHFCKLGHRSAAATGNSRRSSACTWTATNIGTLGISPVGGNTPVVASHTTGTSAGAAVTCVCGALVACHHRGQWDGYDFRWRKSPGLGFIYGGAWTRDCSVFGIVTVSTTPSTCRCVYLGR